MRSRTMAAWAVLLAAGFCASAHGQEEFPLKRVAISGDLPHVAAYAQRSLQGTAAKPPMLKGAPEVSSNAAYYVGRFGDAQVLMLCDLTWTLTRTGTCPMRQRSRPPRSPGGRASWGS